MPRTRLYASDAQRQAAYRARRIQTDGESLAAAVPKPGTSNPWPRWRTLVRNAEQCLHAVQEEMEDFQLTRSERWQQSEKAEEFEERLDALTQLVEQTCDWIAAP